MLIEASAPPESEVVPWYMIDNDIGMLTSGRRTSACVLEDRYVSTITGSRELLSSLEQCIDSPEFQHRIWKCLYGITDPPDETLEESFIVVEETDVVVALAEHLVLNYIRTYHGDEKWNNQRQSIRLVSQSVRDILKMAGFVAIKQWRIIAISLFSLRYPSTVGFIMSSLMWQFMV